MCGFCKVWLCVCVGLVMCGCVYVWFFNVWLCVFVGFVMFGCVYVWVFKYVRFCNVWVCGCTVLITTIHTSSNKLTWGTEYVSK
jgi:hypothetical protein